MGELHPIDLEALATMLRRAIDNAYTATLVGNGAPVTRNYQERASKPTVGDLVAEVSSIGRMRHENATDLDAVGVLEEIAQEKVMFSGDPDFVWDEEEEGQPHPNERVYYIRTLDGRRFRWTNATMIAAVSDRYDVMGNLLFERVA